MADTEFFREYRSIRGKTHINENLFNELVLFFPVILVVKADGRIDWFEEGHINHLIRQDAVHNSIDEQVLKGEIDYLKEHTNEVKKLMLDALKKKNQEEQISNTLMDLLLSAARVSSESQKNNLIFSEFHNFFDFFRGIVSYFVQPDPEKPFISEAEQVVIREILEWVEGLTDRNQELLEYLASDGP